ncbi:hypothetical protein HDV05_000014 [Chytridiales sp. JEL 0842]|nr:hypothetical protein HDV05_000014 [Chytridiales sp. JEL 0842]
MSLRFKEKDVKFGRPKKAPANIKVGKISGGYVDEFGDISSSKQQRGFSERGERRTKYDLDDDGQARANKKIDYEIDDTVERELPSVQNDPYLKDVKLHVSAASSERKVNRKSPRTDKPTPTNTDSYPLSFHSHRFLRMDGEIHPPDFPGFESALKNSDRVAAWLKFKDLCMSESHRKLLNITHIEGVLSLLVSHRPSPKFDFMVKALEFAEELKLPVDIKCYNLMIRGAIALNDSISAKEYLSQMASKDISPDMDTYNLFLDLFVKEENLDGAIAFFGRMIDEGIQPNVETFNTLLHGASNASNPDLVERFFGEMKDLGIEPNAKTWGIILYFQAIRCKNLELAEHTFQQAKETGLQVNAKVATTLMKAFGDAGKLDRAVDVFESAVKEGVNPDTIMYTSLITAYVKSKQPDSALSTFEKMLDAGLKPDFAAFQSLIESFTSTQNPSKAEEILIAVQGRGIQPTIHMYKAIMYAYLDLNQLPDAVRIFEQVRVLGLEPSVEMYNRFLKGLASDYDVELMARYWGRWKTAAKVQESRMATEEEEVGRRGKKVETVGKPNAESYSIVVQGYLTCQSVDRAMSELREMLSLNFEPDPRVFVSLVECLIRHRNYLAAAETMVMMRKSQTAQNGDVRQMVFEQGAQFEDLLKTLLREAKEVESRPSLTDEDLEILESGQGRQAVNRKLKEDVRLRSEAESQRILGIELYRELIAAEWKPQPQTFKFVIEAHRLSGDLVAAVKAWATLKSCYPSTTPDPDIVSTLLECILALGKAQTGRAAMEMVQKDSLKLDERGYTALLCIMAKFGWDDELIRQVVDMVNEGVLPNAKMMEGVVGYLKKGGKKDVERKVVGFIEETWPEALEF